MTPTDFTNKLETLQSVDVSKKWIKTDLNASEKVWKGFRILGMVFIQPWMKLFEKDLFAKIRADGVARSFMKDFNVEAKISANVSNITEQGLNVFAKLLTQSKNKKRKSIVEGERATLRTISDVVNKATPNGEDSDFSNKIARLEALNLQETKLWLKSDLSTSNKPNKFVRFLKQIFVQPFYELVGQDAFAAMRVDNVARGLMEQYNQAMKSSSNKLDITEKSITVLKRLEGFSKNSKRKAVVSEQIANLETIKQLLQPKGANGQGKSAVLTKVSAGSASTAEESYNKPLPRTPIAKATISPSEREIPEHLNTEGAKVGTGESEEAAKAKKELITSVNGGLATSNLFKNNQTKANLLPAHKGQ